LKKAAQKLLKNFFCAGGMGNVGSTPPAQHKKVFLLLFVHKKKPSLQPTAVNPPR
jgi:hypothetical protein